MSEQIIKNEPGIGRVISKKVTPIERATPNIIAFEGRLAAVETAPNSAAGIISFNDFTNGTLIKTDINISGTNGPSINFEITGKSYSVALPPHVINGQTYLYGGVFHTSTSVCSNILSMGIVTLLMDGDGFFNIWFPRIGYWNSFSSMVWISSIEGEKVNRVTGYEDVSKPASTKFIDVTTIQNWNSANDGPNSGLNADLLDGHQADDFMLTTNTDVMVSKFADDTDLDDILASGAWRVQNTNPNLPTGYDWGQLLVLHGSQDTIAQMIFHATEPEASIRTGVHNPLVWSDWAKVWTDKNDGIGTGLNADLLDGYHAADLMSVKTGMIVLWSGAATNIPSGWKLCDGANGTPDLRNRFIIGAGSSYAVGATGGSKDASLVSHNHTINDPKHTHSVTDPGHTHTVKGGNTSTGHTAFYHTSRGAGDLTGAALSKTTGISIKSKATGISIHSTGGTATNKNLPPYFALCYIMKT